MYIQPDHKAAVAVSLILPAWNECEVIARAIAEGYLLLDGVLSLFVTLSLFSAYEAIRGDQLRIRWWLLSGVFCGLAFLTKGPLAIVLWLPPVFAFAWLSESYAKPRWWHYSLFSVIAAAIVTPWLIAVSLQDANFLTEFFYTHNIRRFAGHFHVRPIWYFIPVVLIAGHPWSFLTIPYAKFLFGQAGEVRYQRPPAVGYLLLWSGWCFVFFSLSKCKLPTYLLPAAPALALMIGHYLDQVLRDSSNQTQYWFARFWSARSATATTCLAGVSTVVYIIISGIDFSLSIYVWATLWTTLLVSALLLLSNRRQAEFAWASSSGAAFLLAVMVMHQVVPAYSRGQTLFGPASPLNAKISTNLRPAIATVAHEFSGVPFYLGRSDIRNFTNVRDDGLRDFISMHNHAVLIVENRITAKQLQQQLPSSLAIKPIAQRGLARVVEVTSLKPSAQIAQRPTTRSTR